MNKVIIDARLWRAAGIGRYLRSLVRAMTLENSEFSWILVGRAEELAEASDWPRVSVRPVRAGYYGLGDALGLAKHFSDGDIVHVPHFNVPFGIRRPLVVTIHDLIHLYVKDYRPRPWTLPLYRLNMNRIARHAAAVIAVSAATARDCERHFAAMKPKLRVIHEAASEEILGTVPAAYSEDSSAGDADSVLALYVGAIREHKNVRVLLDAWDIVERRLPGARLVIVGKLDPRFESKHGFTNRVRKNPRITYLGETDDAWLAALYRRAQALVLPSSVEGFGLPVVEAMSFGLAVILSDIPPLREIARESAVFVPPGQIDPLAEALYNVLADKGLRQKIGSSGILRSKEFSWNKAARETLRVYREVCGADGSRR